MAAKKASVGIGNENFAGLQIQEAPPWLGGVLLVASFVSLASAGCATAPGAHQTGRATSPEQIGWIQFKVGPEDVTGVEIYLDENYYGELSRWHDGIVRIPVGERRVEIRAPGYFTQRFDFEIKPNDQATFTIKLEPEFEPLETTDDEPAAEETAGNGRRAPGRRKVFSIPKHL